MCGIGGILRTDGQPIPEAWLDAIDARIAYRGPDGSGRFRDRVEIDDPAAPGGKSVVEVAFVHRRLSIIDHAGGRQPMVSQRGRNDSEGLVAVVFNGCIYNHRELRKELESKGHRFITDHSDTEVLIHGWREWGENLIGHLEGMYAFAIWDRIRHGVFLAQDWFEEKPLYVRHFRSAAADKRSQCPAALFGSDARSIAELPALGAPLTKTRNWLIPYLLIGHAYISVPDLGGAEIVSIGNEGMFSGGEAMVPSAPNIVAMTNAVSTDQFESLISQAVSRRLEADVPLGCFLSGGVDSSMVALFAKRGKPDLQTFTVRMPDPRYDESPFAERVAAHLGARHATLEVNAKPSEDLLRLIKILGQPFGDSSILPTYWVSKAARQQVKVALSGDGGDELFLGYERYLAAPFLAKNWKWLRHIPTNWLRSAHPKSRFSKLARLVAMARDFRSLGIVSMEAIFRMDELRSLDPSIMDKHAHGSEDQQLADGIASLSGWTDLVPTVSEGWTAELRDFDRSKYLPNDLLRKVDVASMACGLEVRCPFLDRDLARAALSTPIDQLMPGGQRKGLLRRIARKYLPKEIVDRPKMGFAIPIGEWFRDDDLPRKGGGMKTLLLDHLNSAEPFGPISLNKKAVRRFINEHMLGKRDHGQRLFTLLTLSIWAKQVGRLVAPDS